MNVTNLGNVEDEVRLFTSDGLRGWSATISVADSDLTETCRVRNGDELLCTLGVGRRCHSGWTFEAHPKHHWMTDSI